MARETYTRQDVTMAADALAKRTGFERYTIRAGSGGAYRAIWTIELDRHTSDPALYEYIRGGFTARETYNILTSMTAGIDMLARSQR